MRAASAWAGALVKKAQRRMSRCDAMLIRPATLIRSPTTGPGMGWNGVKKAGIAASQHSSTVNIFT